ncbi:38625_t:CDS:2, partial [Gigaspora margarita]
MKKIHNTRGKTEETLTKAHTATLEAADMEDDVSEGISGSSSMNPTFTDWSEIIECEEATENQQKELETNDLRPNTNRNTAPNIVENTGQKTSPQRTKMWS